MEKLLSKKDEYKTWEEEMYWKHFHAMHFCVVLPKDFHHHLVLPSKFAEHVSSKLPNMVSLIGPSSSSWDVEVSKTGNQISLVGDGWKDFAKAYNLEENLMMVFKYKQKLSLEALIFDQKNMCEKESSYFVKKSLPRLEHRIDDRKRSAGEITSTELLEDNDDAGGSECVLSKKPKKDITEAPRTSPADESSEDNDDDDDDPEFIVSDKAIDDVIVEVIDSAARKSHQHLKSCVTKEVVTKDGGRPSESTKSKAQAARKLSEDITARELNQLNEVEQIPTENEEKDLYEKVVLSAINQCNAFSDALSTEVMKRDSSLTANNTRKPGGKRGRQAKRPLPNSAKKLVFKSGGTKRLSKEYVSRRRPVTSEEKEDALRRANEALTEGGFIVVMRPTGVYKRFYLNIPAEWMHKNLPGRHKEVVLRVGEKTWVTMFHYYGQRGHSGGLATGWKNFAIQNNLEDSDVCVFKPANKMDDATLFLDVEIFRVVQEITPLTPLICSV